jgi:hypothetical protein
MTAQYKTQNRQQLRVRLFRDKLLLERRREISMLVLLEMKESKPPFIKELEFTIIRHKSQTKRR